MVVLCAEVRCVCVCVCPSVRDHCSHFDFPRGTLPISTISFSRFSRVPCGVPLVWFQGRASLVSIGIHWPCRLSTKAIVPAHLRKPDLAQQLQQALIQMRLHTPT